MRMLRNLAVLLALFGGASNAAAADTVLVTAARGVAPKLGNAFFESVKRSVPQKVVKAPALKVNKMNDRAQALTQACAAKRAGFAVDTLVERGKLSVIVVSAQGDTVFEKSGAYPKAPVKQKALLLESARGAASAIKASAPVAAPIPAQAPSMPTAPQETTGTAPAESNNDAYSSGSAPPWMGTSPSAPKPAPSTAGSSSSSSSATAESPAVRESGSKSKRDGGGRGDFRIALGAIGGGGGYKENIDSSRNQGDRDVKISMAPLFGGQLEMEHAVGFRLDASFAKQSATLKPDVTDPEDIKIKSTLINGRISQRITNGEIPIAIALGGGYEKLDAGTQPTVLWVPSNKLLTTFIGLTVQSGDLTSVGLTFEGGAGLVPWGKHSRTADTVKTDSRAFGGQGFVRGRYQFPKALGSSAGVFLELAAQLRYLSLSPGDVTLPADDGTVRTNALPVGDEKSTRFDYAASASVGIMWRPGD